MDEKPRFEQEMNILALFSFVLYGKKRPILYNKGVLPMVLKTGTVKEPKKELITGFWLDRGPTNGQTSDVINN